MPRVPGDAEAAQAAARVRRDFRRAGCRTGRWCWAIHSPATSGEAAKKGVLPRAGLPAGDVRRQQHRLRRPVPGYTANLAELQKSRSERRATSTSTPDPTASSRRVPMLAEYDGAYYEPLSLAMVRMLHRRAARSCPAYPATRSGPTSYVGLEWLRGRAARDPGRRDGDGARSLPRQARTASSTSRAVDVLNERVDAAELKGKIVLVGTTAPGLLDLRATPVDAGLSRASKSTPT